MEIEDVVVEYLNEASVGATAYPQVPSSRPASLVVVEQTGGSSEEGVGWTYYVDLDCWAPKRSSAASLAQSVIDAMLAMPGSVKNVFNVEVTTSYRNPDLESSPPYPRHTVGVEITAIG